MSNQFEITEAPAQPTLVVKRTTTVPQLSAEIGHAYGAIMGYLASLGEQPAGMPFVCYTRMGPDSLDVEIGFPVGHAIAGQGEVQASDIPGGKRAVTMHKGSYESIGATYGALMGWLGQQGLQPAGPFFESYLNSPQEVPASELMTRIDVPLA